VKNTHPPLYTETLGFLHFFAFTSHIVGLEPTWLQFIGVVTKPTTRC